MAFWVADDVLTGNMRSIGPLIYEVLTAVADPAAADVPSVNILVLVVLTIPLVSVNVVVTVMALFNVRSSAALLMIKVVIAGDVVGNSAPVVCVAAPL